MRIPEKIMFRGAAYVKAARRRGRSSAVISDASFSTDGVTFYIDLLFISGTGRGLPAGAKQVKKVPESILAKSDFSEENKEEAEKAAGKGAIKDSRLWHFSLEDQGWIWRGKNKGHKKLEDIQKTINLIEKYRKSSKAGTNPLLYADISSKLVQSEAEAEE